MSACGVYLLAVQKRVEQFGRMNRVACRYRKAKESRRDEKSKAAAALATWLLGLTRAAMPTFSELRGSLGDGDGKTAAVRAYRGKRRRWRWRPVNGLSISAQRR